MILPDVQRVWACIHEAGHATAARAFGLEVLGVDIHADGSGVTRLDPAATLSPLRQLVMLAAGAAAVMHRWPAWRRLSAAGGCGDFEHIEALIAAHLPEEDHHQARLATIGTADRFVVEYDVEITRLAGALLAAAG